MHSAISAVQRQSLCKTGVVIKYQQRSAASAVQCSYWRLSRPWAAGTVGPDPTLSGLRGGPTSVRAKVSVSGVV